MRVASNKCGFAENWRGGAGSEHFAQSQLAFASSRVGRTRWENLDLERERRRLQAGARGADHAEAGDEAGIDFVELRDGRWKLHPLADWSDRDVWDYLQKHDLPYHPLWHDGYVSIGDVHTTRRLEPGMSEEDTRYFGLKRECGLHFDDGLAA